MGMKENEFLDKEGLSMNQFLKKIVPEDQYVDLYENSRIQKLDVERQIPYMFDGNHYSWYGAEQAVIKIISPKIIHEIK